MISADHPGFCDADYRKRRNHIALIAKNYKAPGKVPDVHYTHDENIVWETVFRQLNTLHKKYAWSGYLASKKSANVPNAKVPQLAEINKILERESSFQLAPVEGLVSSRRFLSHLANNIMLSTQYIRHYSVPNYTPEPDIIHEILGHAIHFCNPEYCLLNQRFGMAALNCDDEQLSLIERVYWYTIEFGLVKENDALKAFGAGLISSIGELNQINTVSTRQFNIKDIVSTTYDTEHLQPTLFCANSYEQMRDEILEWLERFM